ncbi:MAG: acyltransferase family protein [Tahibacter sp.]
MDTATPNTRYYFLDWVRIAAFALLVLYHTGMYYVTWDWHVKSPHASSAIEPLMLLSSPWRLSLLFLISGVATAFLLGKGMQGFFRMRSRRLLIPLIFGMLVIVPPQAYYQVVEQLNYPDGYLAFWGRYLHADHSFCKSGDCLDLPTWNHLWFVAYLWVYTLLVWLAARFAPKVVERLSAKVGSFLSGPMILIAPFLLLAIARVTLVAIFEQTHALTDDWYNHAQYFSVFVLGFLIARNDEVWASLQRLRWSATLLAIASYLFLIGYFFVLTSDEYPPTDLLRTVQRTAWALNQWLSIAAIIGWARQWAPGDSAVRRYLTEAVFPVYILHQTLIVVFAHNLKPLDLPVLPEGVLLVVATYACCFAGYELIRRATWLRPLFGLNLRPAASLALPDAAPSAPRILSSLDPGT